MVIWSSIVKNETKISIWYLIFNHLHSKIHKIFCTFCIYLFTTPLISFLFRLLLPTDAHFSGGISCRSNSQCWGNPDAHRFWNLSDRCMNILFVFWNLNKRIFFESLTTNSIALLLFRKSIYITKSEYLYNRIKENFYQFHRSTAY